MEQGLILVNTGPGKGKTTAALGVAVRALGRGWDVAFLQFIKNQATGESRFLETYAREHPSLEPPSGRPEEAGKPAGRLFYKRMGLGFVFDSPSEEDRARAAEALKEAGTLLDGTFGLVVLDEICVAMAKGLIKVPEVLELIKSREPSVNMILTGRNCPEEIIETADTVTEMRVVKHAYLAGVKARAGIEF